MFQDDDASTSFSIINFLKANIYIYISENT